MRSFTDSNGDGIGDLAGLTSRLDYLKDLGVDAIWLMPVMPTAFKDSGYDVSDYRDINPDYGDLAAFDALLAAAHQRKMRVLMDLVLNHTSSEHAWFKDSRTSKTSPQADWYVWSDTPSRADIGCGTGHAAVRRQRLDVRAGAQPVLLPPVLRRSSRTSTTATPRSSPRRSTRRSSGSRRASTAFAATSSACSSRARRPAT